MIVVTVGAQMPFPRLINTVDDWALRHPDAAVLAQIGEGEAKPNHIESVDLVGPEELRRLITEAEVVVAHAGMGTIITCLELGAPLVIFPREGSRRETRNDHQLATASRFGVRAGIWVASDAPSLEALLDSRSELRSQTPVEPETSPALIAAIRSYVDA